MTGTLLCRTCDEDFPLAANIVDLRRRAGLRMVTVVCPSCGLHTTHAVPRAMYRLLWDLYLNFAEAEGRVAGRFVAEMEAAGDRLADLIGDGRG